MPCRKIGKKAAAPEAAPQLREPRATGREHTGERNLITTKPRLERVTGVIDGATFETESRERPVRLANISVVEADSSRGREAKHALERLIDGKLVSIKVLAEDGRNGTVAEVRVGRRSANRAMERFHAIQLGERLRTLRKRHGLSQQAVADALGLPRIAVTHAESGRRYPAFDELLRLAEVYGHSFPFLFPVEEGQGEEELSVLLHRALPEMGQDLTVGTSIRHLLDICSDGEHLRRFLGWPAPQDALPDHAARVLNMEDAIRQGEAAARAERRRLALGNAPIPDITRLLNEQGIWAAATGLPGHLSGLTVVHSTVGFATLANQQHTPVRRRCAHAHEYAHVLFNRSEVVVASSHRESTPNLRERRANAFAAAFLMPSGGVAEQLERIGKGQSGRRARVVYDVAEDSMLEARARPPPGARIITCPDVVELACHFGVGYEAMVGRLRDLNHISAPAMATLLAQQEFAARYVRLLGTGGAPDEEPSEAHNHEFHRELIRLAVEAHRRQKISRGRFAEIGGSLGMDRYALRELVRELYPD